MPCRVSEDEIAYYDSVEESKRLAKFIIKIDSILGNHPHVSILSAAATGEPNGIETLSKLLCDAIRELDEDQLNSIVYIWRDKESRALADWWDEHQANDLAHEEEDAADAAIKARPEVRDLTADNLGVIVDRSWYERACKIVDAVDFVN